MKKDLIRQLQEISALLNSSLEPAAIRRHAIAAATLLLEAEAGSLLLLDEAAGELYFDVAHGAKGSAVRRVRLKLSQGIAGYVARTGEPLLINDVPGDTRFYRHVDAVSGYETRKMVCVPVTARGHVLGVLQVINHTAGRPFSRADLEHLVALGHQVGIAIDNARLYQEIHHLFEGFISASVQAIESRDPATSGHSQRVAVLTCGLALAVSRSDVGPYAAMTFNAEQLTELRYAAVLHDFGKVGVREHILLKGQKLYPHQQDLIRSRFAFIKRTAEVEVLKRKLEIAQQARPSEWPAAMAELDGELSRRLKEVDEALATILRCNEPDDRSAPELMRLQDIARLEYASYEGVRPFLTTEETAALGIAHGTLTSEERDDIARHVTHTYEFLSKIPWTRTLKQVPRIAWAHHEKLDGSGYPRGLTAEDIPLEARMMTICDIYDALTACDRPYRAAVPIPTALSFLRQQGDHGKLDKALVDLFIQARVYRDIEPPAAMADVI